MQPVWTSTLRFHDRLLTGALRDDPVGFWEERPAEGGNTMAFVALHLVDVRLYLANYVGLELPSPWSQEIQKAKSAEQICDYPSPAELLKVWSKLADPVHEKIESLDDEWLDVDSKMPFPFPDRARGGDISFFVHHESYHIGQVALLRRQFGLPDLYSVAFPPSA